MIRKFLYLIIFLHISIYTAFSVENLFFKIDDEIKVQLEITDNDIKILNKSLKLFSKGNIPEALSYAYSIKNENLKESMTDYLFWKKYTYLNINYAENDFNSLVDFVINHQYLPNIRVLKEKIETMFIVKNISYNFIKDYFDDVKPVKASTAIRILKEELKLNNPNIKEKIIDTFYDYDFSSEELNDFLINFSSYLKEENYETKIEKLIWDTNEEDNIKKLLSYVSKNNKILYNSILSINKNPKNTESIIKLIPKKIRNNEVLMYKNFIFQHKKGNTKEAIEILLGLENIKHPQKWWYYLNYYSRELLKTKEYKKSFLIASKNNLTSKMLNYSDAQFLSGFIALKFLKKPKIAQQYFYKMYEAVSYPISKTKSMYWIARSYEDMNNLDEALYWYDLASKNQLYFYGQFSLLNKNRILNIPSLTNHFPLPNPPSYTKEEEEIALNNDMIKLASLMVRINDNEDYYTSLFTSAINKAETNGIRSAMFEIIKSTKNEKLITIIAKRLTYKNVYFIDNLYPVLRVIKKVDTDYPLVHAIIKQESGFHISAKSSVGAIGFMQIMPSTAKLITKTYNLRYSEKDLRTNPAYNILLGSKYIRMLKKQFKNTMLVIAAYNAGPNAVNKWIKTNGDPINLTYNQIVDWIELIGYSETRNYVQRVLENNSVYECILDREQYKELFNKSIWSSDDQN